MDHLSSFKEEVERTDHISTSTFMKEQTVCLDERHFPYIYFKAHAVPCTWGRRTCLTCPLARTQFKTLSPKCGVWGEEGVGKKSFVRKESSSQIVWEYRIQGSGHTDRVRLGAKKLPPNDLKNKKKKSFKASSRGERTSYLHPNHTQL